MSHAVIEEENKPQEPGPSKTEALDDGAAKRIKLGDDVAQECVTNTIKSSTPNTEVDDDEALLAEL